MSPAETGRIWIVSPRQAPRVVRRLGGAAGLSWCYLGSDVRQQNRLRRQLPASRLMAVGPPLDRLAGELRQPFVDWIADVGRHQPAPLTWWASKLAFKGPLQTDCFRLVCYSQLVRSWMTQPQGEVPRVVVVEDPWLAAVLRRQGRGRRDVKVLAGGRLGVGRELLVWGLKALAARAVFLAWAGWMVWRVRRCTPRPRLGGQQPAVFLYTWIDGRCFASPGTFQDPYTGRLEALLRREGHLVRRFTPLQLGIRRGWLRELGRFSAQFVVTPRYTTLGDIARAAGAWFWIHAIRRMRWFQQTDCAPLLWREVLREWGALEFSSAQLWHLTLRRMVRDLRPAIRLIIYPFENHPWEKLLCLAVRDEAPEIPLIGYQHSCVSPLLLNYGVGQGERGRMPLPDVVVANGPLSRALLQEAGFRPDEVCDGGALRYEHLLSDGSPPRRRGEAPPRVLVTLPIVPAQALALVQHLLEAFSTPLEIPGRGRVEFVLKGHPRLPVRKLLRGHGALPTWVAVTEDPLSALWPHVDALLYSPLTASWLEAYAVGLPVVKYHGELLNTDVEDRLPRGAVATCSRDTVRSTLERLLSQDTPVDPARRQREVRERIFSPVQDALWAELARSPRAAVAGREGTHAPAPHEVTIA